MKKYLIVFICLINCISCVSQKKEIVRKSTIKLEGKNTGIRDLIEIDGHYPLSSDTSLGSIMFFDDGTWTYFHFKRDISQKVIKEDLTGSIKSWIDKGQVRWGFLWGVYKIKSDTIIVHSYDKPGFLKAWGLSEDKYKVIDRQTIKRVFFKIRTDDDYYKTHSPWIDEDSLHFISADSLPSSDNWLKENKWIWHNEADWKKYMDKIKAEKKLKK